MRFFISDKKGFTMIELLVAISIVAILATVAFGTLQEGRKKARDIQRVSDISQIQLALRLYKDAYSGYPTGYDSNDTIGDGTGLDTTLSGYLANSIKDPSHNGTTYQYIYDSSFVCGGVAKKVLYAKTMEQTGAGNWATICTGTTDSTDSTNTYGVILQ